MGLCLNAGGKQVAKGVAIVLQNEVIGEEVTHESNQFPDSQLTQ